MNKDFDLKNDPHYSSLHLREKVSDSVKRLHDEAKEVKEPQVKAMPKGLHSTNKNYDSNKIQTDW